MCGVVGVKPTYGGVSRYGMVAFSSSLDQAGTFGRTVLDAATLHAAVAGHDPRDGTSVDAPVPAVVGAALDGARGDLAGLRVGVVDELGGPEHAEGFEEGVLQRMREAFVLLEAAGAEIRQVSWPSAALSLPAYYLIACSEASSNLARFDGVRFGPRTDGPTATAMTALTREAGFGPETKRRMMLGTYALSAGYYDAYYGTAQKVRTLVRDQVSALFSEVDVLVSATSPTVAFALGERVEDPVSMYRADLCTIPASLAGLPAASVPIGTSDGLPVGMQVMAPTLADDRVYRFAAALEARVADRDGGPFLDRLPDLVA